MATAASAPAEPQPELKRKDPPPPSPERTGKLHETKTGQYTLRVSDIEMSAGETGTATLEVQPSKAWSFNTLYPVKVELSGSTVSMPANDQLHSKRDDGAKKQFAITSGGMRVDVPFKGQVQGEDTVTAKLKFGLCSATTCQSITKEVDWTIAVR